MRSNYKKLGQFIKEVSVKNKDLSVELLLGVSITKQFIPSIANTVGTDMSKYKVVEHHQFAYGPVTSRNGEKISVALLGEEKCIVSTSYTVFEIVDTERLDPEYLMMWFRRSEFDRYARYMSHGTVRELFGWQEMCDVELPIPSIEKQREIVREYNVVNDRIALNEQLTQKLEDTAQAIYKQWFVDFDFPISKEYAESIGKPELEGKPYKDSGGSLCWNDLIEGELPSIWDIKSFTQEVPLGGGGTPNTAISEYWGGEIGFFTGRDVTKGYYALHNQKNITELGLKKSSAKLYPKNTTFILCRGATTGSVAIAGKDMAMNQSCYAMKSESGQEFYVHQLSLHLMKRLKAMVVDGAIFNSLVTKDFDEQKVVAPPREIKEQFNQFIAPIYHRLELCLLNNTQLNKLIELLHSKLSNIG
ncbi:restriction endonuclease subunit S [Vibrio breoganii]|uniref:restriction endonuclease subunit S n=2 Tax=Vibrio TaxID=662 RepID=UPI001482009A|nr:restriction endonuclease subunit S [Vibrio sp. F13]